MISKRSWLLVVPLLVAALSFALLAAACGDDDDDGGDGEPAATEPAGDGEEPAATEPAGDGTEGDGEESTIDVGMTEFALNLSSTSAAAGTATFNVSNDGLEIHNFEVIASELPAGELPVDEAAFVVDETQVDLLASTGELGSGESEELPVNLEPGRYVLICNVPSHYQSGMFAEFTVE